MEDMVGRQDQVQNVLDMHTNVLTNQTNRLTNQNNPFSVPAGKTAKHSNNGTFYSSCLTTKENQSYDGKNNGRPFNFPICENLVHAFFINTNFDLSLAVS